MSKSVSFSVLCLFLFGFASGQSGQSPDKVYQILSANDASVIMPSDARSNQQYIALDTQCIPKYFPGNFSGSWNMVAADTMKLRIIYDEDDLENCGTFDVDLRNRARDLFLGIVISTTFEPELVDTINAMIETTSRSSLSSMIASRFKTDVHEVMVLVHDNFVSLYDADPVNQIIKITDGGLNAHILLHEIGHVLNLSHPVQCCNICTDLSLHFMYDHVSSDAVLNQIMIQDWLMIIDACDGNSLCNDCDEIGMTHENRNDLYPRAVFTSLQMAVDPPESIIDFINCIDCSVRQVDLSRVTLKDLKELCKLLFKQQKSLKEKFETEFEYYNRDLLIDAKQRKDYIASQVQRRKLFSLERFEVLVEIKKGMALSPDHVDPMSKADSPQQYEKLHQFVQKSIEKEQRVIQRPDRRVPDRQQPDKKQPGGKQPGGKQPGGKQPGQN